MRVKITVKVIKKSESLSIGDITLLPITDGESPKRFVFAIRSISENGDRHREFVVAEDTSSSTRFTFSFRKKLGSSEDPRKGLGAREQAFYGACSSVINDAFNSLRAILKLIPENDTSIASDVKEFGDDNRDRKFLHEIISGRHSQ